MRPGLMTDAGETSHDALNRDGMRQHLLLLPAVLAQKQQDRKVERHNSWSHPAKRSNNSKAAR